VAVFAPGQLSSLAALRFTCRISKPHQRRGRSLSMASFLLANLGGNFSSHCSCRSSGFIADLTYLPRSQKRPRVSVRFPTMRWRTSSTDRLWPECGDLLSGFVEGGNHGFETSEALMAAWTRKHGKNDSTNPYSILYFSGESDPAFTLSTPSSTHSQLQGVRANIDSTRNGWFRRNAVQSRSRTQAELYMHRRSASCCRTSDSF
jgi:hypothetical protein